MTDNVKEYRVQLHCNIELYRPHLGGKVFEEIACITLGIWYNESRAKEHYLKCVKGNDKLMIEVMERLEMHYEREVIYTVKISDKR